MKFIITLLTSLSIGISVLANTNSVQINSTEAMTPISGITTGYNKSIERKKDGYVDVSIVMPALTKKSILFFDLNNIISPKSETIKVLGQRLPLPSNLSIPKQKESYLLTFKLNKPKYTVFVSKKGRQSISAIHGKFKVRKVVDQILEGKPIVNLLNDTSFIGGDQITVDTNKKTDSQNLHIKNFQYNGKAKINAPIYDSRNLSLFSLPLAYINNSYHPTDLKYVQSGKFKYVTTNKKSPMYALNILTDQIEKFTNPKHLGGPQSQESFLYQSKFSRVSLSILPLKEQLTPTFLDFVDPPYLSSDASKLHFSPPAEQAGTTPLATIVELIEAKNFENGKLSSENKKTLWKKVLPGWKSNTSLPNIELIQKAGATFRYEVSFVATNSSAIATPQTVDLNKFSLLTKNYLVIE